MEVAVIEPASSGRSRCRACREPIEKGALRLGQRVPNPYGEGEATFWFHVACAAAKCPALVAAVLEGDPSWVDHAAVRDTRGLRELGLRHEELTSVGDVDRAPTGRARCRQCRDSIAKESLRVGISRLQDGMLSPEGFVHLGCAPAKFEGPLLEFLEARGPSIKPGAWDEAVWSEVSATLGADARGSGTDERGGGAGPIAST